MGDEAKQEISILFIFLSLVSKEAEEILLKCYQISTFLFFVSVVASEVKRVL